MGNSTTTKFKLNSIAFLAYGLANYINVLSPIEPCLLLPISPSNRDFQFPFPIMVLIHEFMIIHACWELVDVSLRFWLTCCVARGPYMEYMIFAMIQAFRLIIQKCIGLRSML